MATVTRPTTNDSHPDSPRGSHPMVIPDRLEMLVTGDPVAELDAALRAASAQLRTARQHGDPGLVERLARWVDMRLDQRNGFPPPP